MNFGWWTTAPGPSVLLASGWRAQAREAHRLRENLRALSVSAGALAVAWGILRRRRWAGPLLGAGILVWTGLYLMDLAEARRVLGGLPWLFAPGQGLNLLFLAGLWAWLRRDDRQPLTAAPS